LPSSQQQSYELTVRLAREQLACVDVEELCRKTGAQRAGSNEIIIKYLNRSYLVALPDGEISLTDGEEQVPLKDKILILHYLTLARGTPIASRLISYKQLPGGASYFAAFSQRVMNPILNRFGKEPKLIIDAAVKMGGYKADYGDVSVGFNAFPRVPITIALWRGDEEFAPGGNIMFDSSISDYLSTEDISVLCETIAWRLARA
jgi:hypothetical protein